MTAREPIFGRTFWAIAVGIFLVAAGLVVMYFPVPLSAYDRWGFQITCGNAFKLDLTQALLADQHPSTAIPAPAADSHSYAQQCRHASALRRLWTIPTAAVGVTILCAYACAGVLSSDRRPRRRTTLAYAPTSSPATPTEMNPSTPLAADRLSTAGIADHQQGESR
jgi:hypothetical protein